MGVPTATPPASAPASGAPGRLKPLGTVVVVLGVMAVAVTLTSYVLPKASRPVQSPPAPQVEQAAAAVRAVTHSVVYELSGAKGAQNVTYVAQGSELMQKTEVTAPWTTAFERKSQEGRDEFYSVSAQGAGSGVLKCRIVVDGEVVSDHTAPAAGAPVTCTA
ncbi:MmpS family transport accessory protein [Amycolatopsis orientalis]|uniref:MmpS family transport accessory protein n=1 Tax=Amycolatopsis orientalis TaxID=31958 RepID=UPI0004244171|nr:MmpS family transport accessory protein [Amycolatopsis orientalis]